ncbi:MAG: alanine racemase [Oscillospiraceae bacterium]
MNNFYKRTWAEINLDALKNNIDIIKRSANGKEIIAVVKANSYGHGDIQCSRVLNSVGISKFAVSNPWEAERLRSNNIAGQILILGFTDIDFAVENYDKGYIFTAGSVDYSEKLSEAAQKHGIRVPVHIKINTGMSRVGIDTPEQAAKIKSLKGLDVLACYTHYAVSDSFDSCCIDFTEQQYEKAFLISRELNLPLHTQNSGGLLYHSAFDGDYCRPGIIMYGHKPDSGMPIPDGIKPLMQLKSVVSSIRTIKKGETVSYGRTFTAQSDTRIALIPCGYADGFNRRLSNQWNVIINGHSVPIRGRICMDQSMADITDYPDIGIGDEVIIYSDETQGGSSFEHAADLIGTINYELLCAVGTRVPRVYTENGTPTHFERYL